MRNFIFYCKILINFLRYKLFFKESKKFIIDFGASIFGANMISLGQSFAAKKDLRMEAFGDGKELKIIIGDYVSFGNNVHIGATNKIIIKNNVLFGSNILITDHNHGNYNGENQSSPIEIPTKRILHSPGPIIINDNVWVGDGVVILPNIEIGKGVIIAANTVVNKNISANTIVGGNPMRVIKKYNFDSEKWES